MKLIKDWKQSWRFLSVQFNILGVVILSILMELPNHMLTTWALLPQEFKDMLDKDNLLYMGMGFMILSVIGRLISQAKRGELTDDEDVYSKEAEMDTKYNIQDDINYIKNIKDRK